MTTYFYQLKKLTLDDSSLMSRMITRISNEPELRRDSVAICIMDNNDPLSNKFIAWALVTRGSHNAPMDLSVYVPPSLRKKKLGSALVRKALQHHPNPRVIAWDAQSSAFWDAVNIKNGNKLHIQRWYYLG